MSKVPLALPGIPTDEVPLHERIQYASRSVNGWAIKYVETVEKDPQQAEIYLRAMVRAGKDFLQLIAAQDPARPVGT